MGNRYKNRILLSCMCVVLTVFILMMTSHVLGDKYSNKNDIVVRQKENSIENEAENIDDELTSRLQSSFDMEQVLDMKTYPTISASALEIIYERNMSVEIKGKDYSLVFKGEDITDYSSELDTAVEIKKVENGYKFTRNMKNIIPGDIVLKINNKAYKGKYIYIYNKTQDKYLLLSDDGKGIIQLANNEEYLIVDKKLYEFKLNYKWLAYVGIGFGILLVIYILVRKRYWFW